MDLKSKIRTVPNFPKEGIMFRDITTLLMDIEAVRFCVDSIAENFKDVKVNKILAAESRGFIFSAMLADRLNSAFIPARKPGKLPYTTIKKEFETEYSTDAFEIHSDSISTGDNVLIIDDLLATGGTAKAMCDLVSELGANVSGLAFLIELSFLNGRSKLPNQKVFSLITYDEE